MTNPAAARLTRCEHPVEITFQRLLSASATGDIPQNELRTLAPRRSQPLVVAAPPAPDPR